MNARLERVFQRSDSDHSSANLDGSWKLASASDCTRYSACKPLKSLDFRQYGTKHGDGQVWGIVSICGIGCPWLDNATQKKIVQFLWEPIAERTKVGLSPQG